MSKSKKNTQNNAQNQNSKGYQDNAKNNATDSVRSDNGSHAENRSDKSSQ